MPIGHRFYAWGDMVLNYTHARWCLLEKNSSKSAHEIITENKIERVGICALMEEENDYLTVQEVNTWTGINISY